MGNAGSSEDKHVASKVKPRKGFYRKKGDGQKKKYRKTWAGHSGDWSEGKGYGKLIKQIHHILPEDSIYNKAVDLIEDEEERKTVKVCMLKSEWNINDKKNLIGLPDLYAFLIYFDWKERQESDATALADDTKFGSYISARIQRLNERAAKTGRGSIKLTKLFGELSDPSASPEGFPVHLPTDWGHTEYNKDVAKDVESKVISKVKKAAKKHELDITTVNPQFDAIVKKWKAFLQGRSAGATYELWKTQYTGATESAWRTPFTMSSTTSLS